MNQTKRTYDAEEWTGKPDPMDRIALAAILIIGAVAFAIVAVTELWT